MPTRTEVIGAFVGPEDVDEFADLAEHGLEARQGRLDRMDVPAAGREAG